MSKNRTYITVKDLEKAYYVGFFNGEKSKDAKIDSLTYQLGNSISKYNRLFKAVNDRYPGEFSEEF